MRKTENVILLAMSVLPPEIDSNAFYYENKGKRWDFCCESQLGPETKVIWELLAEEGKEIDRIVVLETPPTRERGAHKRKAEIESFETSAVEFYKEEIVSYTNISEECFKDILLGEEDSFIKAVDAILGSKGNEIDLYIDVQGGIRSIATQINAIVELLSSKGVSVKGRFANDYAPREPGPFKIHAVDNEYHTYELVTAMEVFKKYGRGEKLKEYFKEVEKEDEYASKLSGVVEMAANAIKLCDMDMFDATVETISTLNNEFNMTEVSSELKIIYQDIMDDYAPIIDARKCKYVEEIRWCIRKGFLQQALTIIESKMPTVYVDAGIIYFDATDKEKMVARREKCQKAYVPVEHFYFDDVTKDLPYFHKEYKNELDKKWGKRDKDFLAIKCIEECENRSLYGFGMFPKKYVVLNHTKLHSEEERKNAADLFRMHNALKRCRNMVNHSSQKTRPSIDVLEKAMKVYADLAEDVLKCVNAM